MDYRTQNRKLKSIIDTFIEDVETVKKNAYDKYMDGLRVGVRGPKYGRLFTDEDREAFADARTDAKAAGAVFFEREIHRAETLKRQKAVELLREVFNSMFTDNSRADYGYAVFVKKFVDDVYPVEGDTTEEGNTQHGN